MCCSGSRAARRAISDQNRAANAESGTVCSSPRRTRCTLAAISSASARGDSTPASASRAAASATSSSSRLIIAGGPGIQLRGQVGGGQRVDDPVEIAVDDLVQVVGLVAHPVVGDAVLREVVGADPLGPVHGADLAAPLGAGLRVGVGLGLGQPPGPEDRNTSTFSALSLICTSTGSASGTTRTPAAEVWMRPWDSVTGTRCTRCTPPSYFSLDQAPSAPLPLIATVASLTPPRPVAVESRTSVFQPLRSA